MEKGCFIHFIGIGGVSMSGLAIELSRAGCIVSGSDLSNSEVNPYLKEIETFGQIKLFTGHMAENLPNGVKTVIITSTINEENPELIKARELGVNVLQRHEAINILVKEYKNRIGIFGGAGKTTTTALTFFLFQSAGLLPSSFLGSVLANLKSSVHLESKKDFCVFETDESDGSFKEMSMNAGIFVTMENDHLEHKAYHGSYETMQNCFEDLLLKLKQQHSPVCFNEDSYEVNSATQKILNDYSLKASFSIKNKNANFYGENFKFTYGGMHFDIYKNGQIFVSNAFMPLIGEFNALNCLSAIASLSFFVDEKVVKSAILNLRNFEGIDKRQTKVGKFENFDIIDDYAHSPLKIRSMLSGFAHYAREIEAGILPVCEVHKISRFESMYEAFLDCFVNVKFLVLMDVYQVAGYKGKQPDMQKFIHDIKVRNEKLEIIYINNKNLLQELFIIMQGKEWKKNKINFLLFFGAGISSKYAKLAESTFEQIKNQH